jgi:putative membrane protein
MTTAPAKRLGVHCVALLGGLGIVGVLLWNAGISEVVRYLQHIGWFAPLLIFPYLSVALCDAKGWLCAIPSVAQPVAVPLWQLTLMRLAGEAINNLTPTANLGGEPVKVYLLRLQGVAADAGLASVVAAKTALTISQVVFILTGVPFLLYRLEWMRQEWWILGPLVLLAYSFAALLVRWQQKGLMGKVLRLLRRVLPHWRALARWENSAERIDAHLVHFYGEDPRRFFSSVAYHLLGWLLGAGEVWVFFTLMGVQATVVDALIIETMVQPFTAAALIIPGALGVQEAGGVFLCRLLGLHEGAGLTLMALKRVREAVYNLIGLAVIARFSGVFLPRQSHSS